MAYAYNRSLTIDHTLVGASDSTDFPVLVYISDATLKDAAHSGHVHSSSGFDIGFFSDALGTTPLFWEVEEYDNVNGILWAWVKVPTVSHTVDTVFYVFYGDAAITTFQSTTTSVWDSNFIVVFHLNTPGGACPDSAITGSNASTPLGQTGPPAVAGKISKGFDFTGGGDCTFATAGLPLGASQRTISAWFKVNPANGDGCMFSYGTNSTLNRMSLYIDHPSQQLYLDTNDASSAHCSWPQDSNWHHLAGVFPSGGAINSDWLVYLDGAHATTTAGSGALNTTIGGSESPAIGTIWLGFPAASFNGFLDEARISNTARSADWILTEYNNQNAPGTFVTIGTEMGGGLTGDFAGSADPLGTFTGRAGLAGFFAEVAAPEAFYLGVSLSVLIGTADPLAVFSGITSPGGFFHAAADPEAAFTGFSPFGFFTCTQYPVEDIDGVEPLSFACTASPVATYTTPVGQKESCISGGRPVPLDAPNYVY